MAGLSSGAGVSRFRGGAEAQARTLAENAGVAVKAFHFAQTFKQASGIEGGMSASGFVVDENKAQCSGPKIT
jgi:hypothetical protein